GIRARVLILAILPVASVVVLMGYNMASSRLEDAERDLTERASIIVHNLALASEFALFSRNMQLVSDTLQWVSDQPDVKWSVVWDVQRRILVSRGVEPDGLGKEEIVERVQSGVALPPGFHVAPIRVELIPVTDFQEEFSTLGSETGKAASDVLGWAVIEVSDRNLAARRSAIIKDSMLIMVVSIAGSVLLAMLIGNSITEPLMRLLGAVREFRSGNLAARVHARAGGEIGSLEEGLNAMAEALEKGQDVLKLRVHDATSALRQTVAELEVKNAELEQAREIALRAGRERTEFLARMSHEIRTPLNAVVGFSKLLNAPGAPLAKEESLRTIQSAAGQLLHVINDILQFIRLDAEADQLESLPFDIVELLEDTTSMLGPMASEKGLELVLLLHNDLPKRMLGDAARLSQVVVNLVNNAIKFTASGQVVVEAARTVSADGGERLEIVVSDTGIGIAAEEQERIFAAFSQSDSSITRRFGGTGLGLSIAKRLIELMHGNIRVESAKGKGSRFYLDLPCDGCTNPESVDSNGQLSGKRCVVYDLNPFTRRSLRSTLVAFGMQVFNSGRWDQVMQIVGDADAGGSLDAVIIGISPAEQRAGDIERYVDELSRFHHGFVLLLSGMEQWIPPISVREAGPIAWATKPIRRRALLQLLSEPQGVEEAGAQKTAKPPVQRRLVGMQILAAEDNAFNRQLLRHVLEEQGAIVDEAVTGRAAIGAARRGGYHAILMDLHMPEIDGVGAARQIREYLGSETPPIIALTADVFGRTGVADVEKAFDDWLLKP
ncbi:MAG: ATP-binding protein, partial [Gammaproteobacteria bacterium]|nr:ATP-binding protein [Gammaproteobacteria bacterium]